MLQRLLSLYSKLLGEKISEVPSQSTFSRVDSFLGYSAVFMKKGRILKKESALYGNGYNEKEEGRPCSFAQLV
jgi:hypothetical protein